MTKISHINFANHPNQITRQG